MKHFNVSGRTFGFIQVISGAHIEEPQNAMENKVHLRFLAVRVS